MSEKATVSMNPFGIGEVLINIREYERVVLERDALRAELETAKRGHPCSACIDECDAAVREAHDLREQLANIRKERDSDRELIEVYKRIAEKAQADRDAEREKIRTLQEILK